MDRWEPDSRRRTRGLTAVLTALGVAVVGVAVIGALSNHDPASDRPVDERAAIRAAALVEEGIPTGDMVAPGDQYRQVTVELTTGDGRGPATATPPPGLTTAAVVENDVHDGALPVERSIELGPGRLLIVGTSSDGVAHWVATTADPTIVRSEGPDEHGELHGVVLHRPQAELEVRVPADDSITRVAIYRPGPEGEGKQLVGSVSVA
jgi:hypothetical protein